MPMKMYSGSCKFSRALGVIGNFLEHYNSALFGFLAPFLAPLIFFDKDPITGLILTYGMVPLGFLAKPFGAIFLGWVGDKYGRKEALFISLMGMACVTTLMGLVPLYDVAGFLSPLLFMICRCVQGLFTAGETSVGAVFVLERTVESERDWIGSLYQVSSIGGILLASTLVVVLGSFAVLERGWRFLFLFSGLTGFCGVYLRSKAEVVGGGGSFQKGVRIRGVIKSHWRSLVSITLVAGFSYVTYAFAFTLMNGFIPLVTKVTKMEALRVNTVLLILDFILLPIFGALSGRLGREKVMFYAALLTALVSLPLFGSLEGATLAWVVFFRTVIVVLGVAFASSYHSWAFTVAPLEYRSLIMSLGAAFGAQLIGAPAAFISLWLYKATGASFAPGFYLMFVALFAMGAVLQRQRSTQPAKSQSE